MSRHRYEKISVGDCVLYQKREDPVRSAASEDEESRPWMSEEPPVLRGLVLSAEPKGFDILNLEARGWGRYAIETGVPRQYIVSKTNCRSTELQWAAQQLPRLVRHADENEWLVALDAAMEKRRRR